MAVVKLPCRPPNLPSEVLAQVLAFCRWQAKLLKSLRLFQRVLLRQCLERSLGPGAEMLDHLGGGERAEPRRGRKIDAAREPEQKSGREQVPGAGGIDQPLDRKRGDATRAVPGNDPAALLAARHHGKRG